jgi:hypothetical protein
VEARVEDRTPPNSRGSAKREGGGATVIRKRLAVVQGIIGSGTHGYRDFPFLLWRHKDELLRIGSGTRRVGLNGYPLKQTGRGD